MDRRLARRAQARARVAGRGRAARDAARDGRARLSRGGRRHGRVAQRASRCRVARHGSHARCAVAMPRRAPQGVRRQSQAARSHRDDSEDGRPLACPRHSKARAARGSTRRGAGVARALRTRPTQPRGVAVRQLELGSRERVRCRRNAGRDLDAAVEAREPLPRDLANLGAALRDGTSADTHDRARARRGHDPRGQCAQRARQAAHRRAVDRRRERRRRLER